MTDEKPQTAQFPRSSAAEEPAEERLDALLADLAELRRFLRDRGRHTYELSQRFMANARRDPASRAYDERQATMLEYQHYIWHEIAGRVEKLLTLYGAELEDAEGDRSDGGQPR